MCYYVDFWRDFQYNEEKYRGGLSVRFLKDLKLNIIQLIVVGVGLPILCKVMSLISGTANALQTLFDIIGQIDVFDTLMVALTVFVQSGGLSASGADDALYSNILSTVENLSSSISQLLIIALCVNLCCILWTIIVRRGMCILASVAGVLLGGLVMFAWQDIPEIAIGFLMILLFVVDLIFVQTNRLNFGIFILKYLKFCLKLIIDCIVVIFVTGFVAVLLLIWKGEDMSVGMAIFTLAVFLVPTILALALKRYCLSLNEK